MPKVLLFGATGLVGSGIAAELTRNHPDWTLSSYHRNASKDEALRSAYNIEKVYHGTFEDSDKIRAAAKEHDFVINAGESSTLEPSKSIVDGLLERGGSGRGAKGTFVNISGTGNFIDNHKDGKHHPESRVWSDDSEQDMKDIEPSVKNGAADKYILEAGEKGSINTWIVCPSVIYGTHDAAGGVQGVGVSGIIYTAQSLGFVPYIGDGSSKFLAVHIKDVIRFTMKIIKCAASEQPANGSAYSRYYIAPGKYYTWKEVGEVLAPILHKKGTVSSPQPKSISFEEAGPLGVIMGSNMLARAPRAESLGYNDEEKSLLDTMKAEL